jgi:arylsulfatase A-like enzyme
MIPPQLPGSPSYLRPGTPALAVFLRDLGYTTGQFGKNHLGDHTDALPTAHGFTEFWRYLYHLDAMQQVSFPDINKSTTKQGIVPPCKNTPVKGLSDPPGAIDPREGNCLTPPRPVGKHAASIVHDAQDEVLKEQSRDTMLYFSSAALKASHQATLLNPETLLDKDTAIALEAHNRVADRTHGWTAMRQQAPTQVAVQVVMPTPEQDEQRKLEHAKLDEIAQLLREKSVAMLQEKT